ncbi:MAG TPA: cytochrome P460 family protein [Ignavibacteria bacterium]|nr:cytochrome P460 family protein [Ignavibacteria bacterium]HMQ97577.1 cytochrome P460 family protein [Ignavibacteria bacterium]
MKKRKVIQNLAFIFIAFAITGYIFLFSAGNNADDDQLFKWITSDTGYYYYQNNPEILPTTEETERAHDNFMRIRFNKKAADVLNQDGHLPKGIMFPDSSIIVKEIYSEKTGAAEILAVMVKLKGAPNSNKDWLWAEYSPSGDVEYSVSKNGKACVTCHKSTYDNVRIFELRK